MEKTEPMFIPEWLKSSGHSSSNGGSGQFSSAREDRAGSKFLRNKSSVSDNDCVLGQPSIAKGNSSYFQRSSVSTGSSYSRSYSNFGRNPRRRFWDKESHKSRDTSNFRDHGEKPERMSQSRSEVNVLKHSNSVVTGKWGESGLKNAGNGKLPLSEDIAVGSMKKTPIERDFPSLEINGKPAVSATRKVSFPGFSASIENLPMGSSVIIGGDKWTSALAEVPVIGGGSTSTVSSARQASSNIPSPTWSSNSSLNMAETVAKGAILPHTTAELSGAQQMSEGLDNKQSRQLIPMASISKASLPASEMRKTNFGQPHQPLSSSHHAVESPSGASIGSDMLKTSTGAKFHVLKPVREQKAVSHTAKDHSSFAESGGMVSGVPLGITSPGAARNQVKKRSMSGQQSGMMIMEKRLTSQAQSRNDFFNLMRKKSTTNSLDGPHLGPDLSSPLADKSGMPDALSPSGSPRHADAPLSSDKMEQRAENNGGIICNNDAPARLDRIDGRKSCPNSEPILCSEEEEAFLRSLGWEENADEGGLTEEEISSFYRDVTKYFNSKLSFNILQGVQPRFLLPLNSQVGDVGGISS